MPLEATIVCVDNSEWMRNGDYPPSRLDAELDAVNKICTAKLKQNRESSVGVLTMAGQSARMLVTQTDDELLILNSTHQIQVDGRSDFVAGVRKAQLALKHRSLQQQKPRIIVFAGSPVKVDDTVLKRMAKDLKKNNIAVDVVNFGEEADNHDKLDTFVQTVNFDNNSHLVTVPTGPHILSDVLLRSSIIAEDPATTAAASTAEDEENDPDIALAMRLSVETEQARINRAAQIERASQPADSAAPSSGASAEPTGAGDTAAATRAAAGGSEIVSAGAQMDDDLYGGGEDNMQVDEPLLQKALQMSIEQSGGAGASSGDAGGESSAAAGGGGAGTDAQVGHDNEGDDDNDEYDTDDEETRLAIEMSLEEARQRERDGENNEGDGGGSSK